MMSEKLHARKQHEETFLQFFSSKVTEHLLFFSSYGVSITTQLQQSTVPMSDALPPSHDMLSGPPQQKSKYSPQQDEDMLLRLLVANNYENRLRPGPKGNPR